MIQSLRTSQSKKRVQKMKPFLSTSTSLLIFLACILVPAFGQRSSVCDTDPDVVGYSTIEDMNLDMQDLIANVTDGENVFRLCPRTIFNVTEPLTPILNNTIFACGVNNSVENECVFDGGSVQVLIEEILENVSFEGLTFKNFNETSIGAFAPTTSVVRLTNCIWTNFSTVFTISMTFEEGMQPAMRVFLQDIAILNGQAGSMISNDGGLLDINNIAVSNVQAVGLVVTGNVGTTIAIGLSATQCDVEFVTFATTGSFVTIADADIFGNINVKSVFYGDMGSDMSVDSSKIRDNFIARIAGEDGWRGVHANGTSVATVGGLEIIGNMNIQYGIAVDESSMATVASSIVRNNSGLGISAPIFARNDSSISVFDTSLLDNVGFMSTGTIETTCIIGGESVVAVMFVEQNSTYSVFGNYIEDHPTEGCPEGGPRLFMEIEGSGCFNGNESPCDGTCEVLADATECLADTTISTSAPTTSISNTSAPSGSPAPLESAAPSESTAPLESAAPSGSVAPLESTAPSGSATPSGTPAPTPASIPREPSKFPGLQITMTGVDPLNVGSFNVWATAQAEWYSDFYKNQSQFGISNVASIIFFVEQDPPLQQRRRLSGSRNLQQNQQLTLTYDQTISYDQTLDSELSPIHVITQVFASDTAREEYTDRLRQSSDPAFVDIQSVSVVSQSEQTDAPSTPAPDQSPVSSPIFYWPQPEKGKGNSKGSKSKGSKSKSEKGKSTKKHSKAKWGKGYEYTYKHYEPPKGMSTKKHSKSKGYEFDYEHYMPTNPTWNERPSGYQSPHVQVYINERASTVQVHKRTSTGQVLQRPTGDQAKPRLRPT